ncbi:MAG: PQQ-binding-like beta-propeller repeat protein [Planctomycetota bacterium]
MHFLMRIAAVGLCMALFAGCSGVTPRSVSLGDSAPSDSMDMGGGSAAAKALQVDDKRLEEIQFRSLWTNTQLKGMIAQAWFSGEDLYIVRSKTSGSGDNRKTSYDLLRVNGVTGIVDWSFALSGKLEFAPTAYHYPAEMQESHPSELYIVQDDVVYCIDNRYGAENYRVDVGFPVSTSIAVSQDNFIVASWNRRVYGFSKASQLEAWTYITDAVITATPVIGGLDVYVGSEDNNLYALNVGAGWVEGKSWKQATGGKIVSRPLYYSDRVYFGSWDYKVYCRDSYKGLLRWGYPAQAPITQPVGLFREWVFAITTTEHRADRSWRLLALDRSEGKKRWERSDIREILAADPFHCFAMDGSRTLHALRLEDGVGSWSLDMSNFDFVLGQDADQGRARERLGRMFLISKKGLIQAIEPRR